jgi:hypothetical protein
MKYAEIRFAAPVKVGTRDGSFYVAGPDLTIERAGDTVTLTYPGGVVDVPWSFTAGAKRQPEELKVAPAAPPSRQDRRGR